MSTTTTRTRPASKLDNYRLPASVALSPPAVRMLVVSAWTDRDESGNWHGGHDVHPVLSLAATVASEFSRPHRPKSHARPASPELAEAGGWAHDWTTVGFDLVVFDETGDATGSPGPCLASEMFDAVNVAYRAVVANWPAEEDEQRLRKIIGEVKARSFTQFVEHAKTIRPSVGLDQPAEIQAGSMLVGNVVESLS